MSAPRLLIIGHGTTARMAAAIAHAQYVSDATTLVELAPQDVASFDAAALGLPSQGLEVFPAIGPSALNFARFDLWAKLKLAGHRMATLIHPGARCDSSAHIAEAAMICAGVTIDAGSNVGRGTIVGPGSLIGIDTSIGAWCWVGTGVKIGPLATVGSHVVLGAGTVLADQAHIGNMSEFDSAAVCRGAYPTGTFINAEFPASGAHLMRASGTA